MNAATSAPSGIKDEDLRSILDSLPLGIAIRDRGERTVYANPAGRFPAIGAAVGDVFHDGRTFNIDRVVASASGSDYDVRIAVDVTERRTIENELFRRAYFDDLTGLPNRALMERSIAAVVEAQGEAACFALAFIDLDGFKHINDYYGHAVGDGLLVKIAQRLSAEIRDADMLARIGGDEFVLFVSSVDSVADITTYVEHLCARLKDPFFIDGNEVFSSASFGVSLYPQHGTGFDVLRRNADAAMYRGKHDAKGAVKFFEPALITSAADRMQLEQRLRLAIRDRRVCCAYQPKVDLRTGEVLGVEVLLRWRDEAGVIHAPGNFVNLAVELGLMDEITHLVLAETVEALDRINEAFGPDATISVNVAARQADEPTFMRGFIEAIAATGHPRRFMLELTEEAFMRNGRFQRLVLPMARETGLKVSIDDFGVGYSSLSTLADITADEVKVDRSFITGIHQRLRSQSVLKAIESLGQALGMSIVVEGVETFEELAYLQAATRIRCGQGFYFSKPMLLDEISQGRTVRDDLRQSSPARESGTRHMPVLRAAPAGLSRSL